MGGVGRLVMPPETTRVASGSSTSARIIAAGIIIAFCYWASSILVTLLVATLVAYFLDPVVSWLEDRRISRPLGSFIMVMVALALLFGFAWILVERADQFGADWPKYRKPLQELASAAESRLERIETQAGSIAPEERGRQVVLVSDLHPFRSALYNRLGSLYSAMVASTFVPFLVFFMLSAKRQVWHATMQLFPATERTQVKQTLEEVGTVLRGYLAGTMLVGIILVVTSWLFFWGIGLDYSFLTGIVSGLLNLVPYFGVVLAWVPPLLIGLKQYHSIAPFVGIFVMLTFLHLIAANVLFPAVIGRKVHLNALAVTVALLFWGWLWGAPGLILAVPITAIIKVICDHIENWQPVGRWLGA
jgi:predicted PurR-regulated permease PerM